MRRYTKLLFCLLLPLLLLTGCWQEELPENETDSLIEPDQTETARPGIVLPEHFSLPYAPELTLDPITCPDGMQQVITSLLSECLFRLGPDLEPEPCLCESYTYDPQTFTYEFTLRSNVSFSDGTPLTAEDAGASLERARHSERYRARLTDISEISADNRTLTVTLSAANSGFPALLEIPVIKTGTETAVPIGTGPYFFSEEGTNVYLIANQSWWQGDTQPIERIHLVEAGDQDTLLYRFTSHDVQMITADLTGTTPIQATGNTVYRDVNTTILQYIGCNVTRPPLDNTALRQALWQGINRSYLVSGFFSGHARASQFPVSPVSPLYPKNLELPYSLGKLSSAFADHHSERTLSLLVNEENSFKVAAAGEIAATFSAAGLPVEVQALPWSEYIAALTSGQFDLYYGEVKLTADWDLSALLGTGGTLNYGGWASPQTDRLLAAFSASDDRAAAMEQLCTHLLEQAPVLPICFKSTSVLMQAGVLEGLEATSASPFYNLEDCVIHLQDDITAPPQDP